MTLPNHFHGWVSVSIFIEYTCRRNGKISTMLGHLISKAPSLGTEDMDVNRIYNITLRHKLM